MTDTTTEYDQADPHQLIEDQRALIRVEATQPYDHLCPHMVPGPMQTLTYARAVLTWVGVLRHGPAPRRFLLSRDALDEPFVGADALAAQHEQIAHLARLDHIQVRVLDPDAAHLTPYLLRGNRIYVESPAGLEALPDEQYSAYDAHFQDLWEGAAPYTA